MICVSLHIYKYWAICNLYYNNFYFLHFHCSTFTLKFHYLNIMAKKIEQEAAPIVDNQLKDIALKMRIECEGQEADLSELIIQKLHEVESKLNPLAELMEQDERVASLIRLLSKGVSLDEAVDTILTSEHNPNDPRYITSLKETESFCEEHELEHDTIECFLQFIEELLSHISNGEIDREVLEKLWKSFVYDKELSSAFEAGSLKGRNMQIETLRSEREEGDGIGGIPAGATIEQVQPKIGYIEQILKNRR